ncbi:MAG: hypothetical protein AAF492_28615, partial [Verrucomicrobiota bacterium]
MKHLPPGKRSASIYDSNSLPWCEPQTEEGEELKAEANKDHLDERYTIDSTVGQAYLSDFRR